MRKKPLYDYFLPCQSGRMPLADDIRQFCRQYGLRINTDLGQHFLIDEAVLDAIVSSGNIQPDDTVVEIGAGLGILTKELLKKAKRVITIELDKGLVPLLDVYVEEVRTADNLEVVQGNALQVPMPTVPYKIIANIPYHITSPLLRHAFLESEVRPTSLTLLIQREVAEKICDEDDRSLLGIIVAFFGKARIVRHVPPDCFLPPPAVDSSVLHIDCHNEPLTDSETMERVFMLAKVAFSQKRKMLRNTIPTLPDGEAILANAGIDPTRRPQTLSIEEWIALAQATA